MNQDNFETYFNLNALTVATLRQMADMVGLTIPRGALKINIIQALQVLDTEDQAFLMNRIRSNTLPSNDDSFTDENSERNNSDNIPQEENTPPEAHTCDTQQPNTRATTPNRNTQTTRQTNERTPERREPNNLGNDDRDRHTNNTHQSANIIKILQLRQPKEEC